MKVLVVSEGKHELGSDADSSPLVALTRRLLNREAEFIRMRVSSPVIRGHFLRGKSTDYEKRALRWVKYAQQQEFDAFSVRYRSGWTEEARNRH